VVKNGVGAKTTVVEFGAGREDRFAPCAAGREALHHRGAG
jgi:hypothetical protein